MPDSLVLKISKVKKVPVKDVEDVWTKGKDIAEKNGYKNGEFYAFANSYLCKHFNYKSSKEEFDFNMVELIKNYL